MTCSKVLQKSIWGQRSRLVYLPAPVKCLFTEHHLNRLLMKKFKTTLVGDCAVRIAMERKQRKFRL